MIRPNPFNLINYSQYTMRSALCAMLFPAHLPNLTPSVLSDFQFPISNFQLFPNSAFRLPTSSHFHLPIFSFSDFRIPISDFQSLPTFSTSHLLFFPPCPLPFQSAIRNPKSAIVYTLSISSVPNNPYGLIINTTTITINGKTSLMAGI